MIAISIQFPAHRYHANPWANNPNVATVDWPPAPIRLLRALIAIWWRKADHQTFTKQKLDEIIDILAIEPPVFQLPEAVHAHSRAFTPEHRLIFDAFLRFAPDATLVIAWPSAKLSQNQHALLARLLEDLSYFGRAESWAKACLLPAWGGTPNCTPTKVAIYEQPVEVHVPCSPTTWKSRRVGFLQTTPAPEQLRLVEAALPTSLSDAIAVDNSIWQNSGWNSPPALQSVTYYRPPLSPSPHPRPRAVRTFPSDETVARFVLAGRPAPRLLAALRVGELARAALMSGGRVPPPTEFSGRDDTGPLRSDAAHEHSFFLPEDADNDGLIDHIIVFCRLGFSPEARKRLASLRVLRRAGYHWAIALEAIAKPSELAPTSPLLRPSATWRSITPYLMPWHQKRRFGFREQISRECKLRGLPPVESVVEINAATSPLKFLRGRARPNIPQPDRLGRYLRLGFSSECPAPLALGYGCHYGLGQFRANIS